MKIDSCLFPEDLLYDTENFVWIRNNKEKTVTIGITVIMASIAGKLSSIKLKPIGTELEKRLGGSGPATHNPTKPTPIATPEAEELTAGSPEEAT